MLALKRIYDFIEGLDCWRGDYELTARHGIILELTCFEGGDKVIDIRPLFDRLRWRIAVIYRVRIHACCQLDDIVLGVFRALSVAVVRHIDSLAVNYLDEVVL